MNINIVLVGSNPLPCYIQTEYICKEKRDDKDILPEIDKHIFLYSNDTEKYYENIKAILEINNIEIEEEGINLYDKISDGKEIEKKLNDKLEELNNQDKINSIVINFTGGTKAMSVYATNTVRNFVDDTIDYTECYVDARENKIKCYKIGENSNIELLPKRGDLEEYINLDIDKVVKLHFGIDAFDTKDDENPLRAEVLNNKYKDKRYFGFEFDVYKAVYEIADIHFKPENEDIKEEYEKFVRLLQMYSRGKEEYNFIKSINVNENEEYNMDVKSLKKDTLTKFLETYFGIKSKNENMEEIYEERRKVLPNEIDLYNRIANEGKLEINNKGAENIKKFFNGDWFEIYFGKAALEAKERLKKEKNIDVDLRWSYEIKGNVCEIDIIMGRSYNVRTFSLTTDKAQHVKSKFFEIAYRTQQLCGEFGKVTAVSFAKGKKIEGIERAVETFNSLNYNCAKIWGYDDICDYENLVEKIYNEFIK